MERFWRSYLLVRSCLRVLLGDPQLLALTLLAATFSGAITVALLQPSLASMMSAPMTSRLRYEIPYLPLIATYLITSFISLFFNTALVAIVVARMQGTRLTLFDGFAIAADHIVEIVALTLVTAVVGVLLRAVER